MASRFVQVDHDTPLLFPPDMRKWVPEDHMAVRVLCADTHPDHDTICSFRRRNKELLESAFVQVLELAARCEVLKVGSITVAIDGTKVLANASRHSAMSYQRAGEEMRQGEIESRLIVGMRVSTAANDKCELVPDLEAIVPAD